MQRRATVKPPATMKIKAPNRSFAKSEVASLSSEEESLSIPGCSQSGSSRSLDMLDGFKDESSEFWRERGPKYDRYRVPRNSFKIKDNSSQKPCWNIVRSFSFED